MRFLVVGAGALGTLLGGRLAADGGEVVFLDRPDVLDALRARGLAVALEHGGVGSPEATLWPGPESAGLFDFVLLCVRARDAVAAADAVRAHLAHDSAVVPFTAGPESAARVADRIGAGHVVEGFADLAARLVRPGEAHLTGTRRRVVLCEPGGERTWRLECLLAALEAAGLEAVPAADWAREAREHRALEAALGALTAWRGCAVAELLEDAAGRAEAGRLLADARAVAAAAGVDVAAPEELLERATRYGPGAQTTMRLDREAGRGLEVDALLGALAREARRLGVARTPALGEWIERLGPYAAPAAGTALPVATRPDDRRGP